MLAAPAVPARSDNLAKPATIPRISTQRHRPCFPATKADLYRTCGDGTSGQSEQRDLDRLAACSGQSATLHRIDPLDLSRPQPPLPIPSSSDPKDPLTQILSVSFTPSIKLAHTPTGEENFSAWPPGQCPLSSPSSTLPRPSPPSHPISTRRTGEGEEKRTGIRCHALGHS